MDGGGKGMRVGRKVETRPKARAAVGGGDLPPPGPPAPEAPVPRAVPAGIAFPSSARFRPIDGFSSLPAVVLASIDVAQKSSRNVFYRPAALPRARASSPRTDLARRTATARPALAILRGAPSQQVVPTLAASLLLLSMSAPQTYAGDPPAAH